LTGRDDLFELTTGREGKGVKEIEITLPASDSSIVLSSSKTKKRSELKAREETPWERMSSSRAEKRVGWKKEGSKEKKKRFKDQEGKNSIWLVSYWGRVVQIKRAGGGGRP